MKRLAAFVFGLVLAVIAFGACESVTSPEPVNTEDCRSTYAVAHAKCP